MTRERLNLGAWGEDLAAHHLRRLGLKILARNHVTPLGEIDIIARSRREIIFVEVKTRRSLAFGSPAEAVGPRKQHQILKAAQVYLAASRSRLQPRFDVIAIIGDGRDAVQIEHIPAAFGLPEN